MIGDKICEWITSHFPLLTRWIGGMTEWEAVAFAAALMVFMYLLYVAAWNLWLNIAGCTLYINDDEPYEEWMAETWEAM